jgi:pyruvate formate lyase activating enzyme
VELALDHHCAGITSTYNEPLITAEWAREVFLEARAAGLTTSMVSNGHATPEVLDYLAPVLDAMKVDLKCFSEQGYRSLGGRLQPVVDTITALVSRTIWTEVVTLLIPGFNDSEEELSAMAKFLADTDADMPWHLTAFHPDYRMTDRGPTPLATLDTAVTIGGRAGLHHVYGGNLNGVRPDLENTRCFSCGELLITRQRFTVTSMRLCDGACPTCGTGIAGIWSPP